MVRRFDRKIPTLYIHFFHIYSVYAQTGEYGILFIKRKRVACADSQVGGTLNGSSALALTNRAGYQIS